MRLIKLLAYSLLGYVLYELYLGMTEGSDGQATAFSRRAVSGRSEESTKSAAGGKKVGVEEPNGAQRTRTVGRGVVH